MLFQQATELMQRQRKEEDHITSSKKSFLTFFNALCSKLSEIMNSKMANQLIKYKLKYKPCKLLTVDPVDEIMDEIENDDSD